MRQGRGRPEKHEARNRPERSVATLHSLRSLPGRTYREGAHGAVQHELVVKHREGQDHIASDFLIAEHRKVTASFRAEPIQAEREQEGFLRAPPL